MTFTVAHFAGGLENLRPCNNASEWQKAALRVRLLSADSVGKKPVMVFASEKYTSELEMFTFGRSFRARISRSSVQKRRFHQSMIRQFGQTDFSNRIGQKLSVRGARFGF